MQNTPPYSRLPLLVAGLLLGSALLLAQKEAATPSTKLSDEETEQFLRTAKVIQYKPTSKGITNSMRATLSDGRITHDSHIQTIDVTKAVFQGTRGAELNFRDTWKFNVAAYRLGRMLGVDMIPMSLERKWGGNAAAYTWWVDDVLMDEGTRLSRKVQPPDPEAWNKQMYAVWIFDQLIYNMDRNVQNLLITKDWKVWMIDHTRAFRLHETLPEPKNLKKCDRKLLAALRQLNQEDLSRQLIPYVIKQEIKALLGRRDKIVKRFEELIAEKGENNILYDLQSP